MNFPFPTRNPEAARPVIEQPGPPRKSPAKFLLFAVALLGWLAATLYRHPIGTASEAAIAGEKEIRRLDPSPHAKPFAWHLQGGVWAVSVTNQNRKWLATMQLNGTNWEALSVHRIAD